MFSNQDAKQQVFSILLMLLLLISALSPFVGFPVEKIKAADVDGVATNVIRLDDLFVATDGEEVGQEDRYGTYCPDTDAIYIFGGQDDDTGFGDNVLRWNCSGGDNPYLVADMNYSASKVGAIWDSNLSMIYAYGGRRSTTGGDYDATVLRFDPATNTIQNMTELYPNEKFPDYPCYSSRNAVFTPVGNVVYIMVANSSSWGGDSYWYLYRHNPGNHSVTWIDLGIRLDTSEVAQGAYVPEQDAIYWVGFCNINPTEKNQGKWIYRFHCGNETMENTTATSPDYTTEGWGVLYNEDNNWIYVMGGCEDSSPVEMYHDSIWRFSPFNYTTENVSAVQGVSLLYQQDDFFAIYHNATGLGYLISMDNTTEGGGLNAVTAQKYIDQINFSRSNYYPTNNYPSPSNGAVDQSVNPTVAVKVIDNDGNTMNTTWWSNSSGAWLKFGTNTSIANNSWINQTTSNFSGYSTTYYWSANTTDGHSGWDNDTYSFTTENAPASDTPPTQSSESPSNETTGEGFNPHLQITVNDPDGNTMNVTFLTNASGGAWGTIGTNTSVANGTYSQTNSSMDVYGTTFFWKVMLQDGHGNWVNETYWFTTKANTAPAVSSPSPANGATDVSTSTTELSVTINDAEGTTFTWNITAPHIGYATDSGTNGSKTCAVSGLAYNTLYYWYVNVTDGNDTTNEAYSFRTEHAWSSDNSNDLIPLNVTNFTTNWLRFSFESFIYIFGNLFWGIFFGFILGGVYVNDKKPIRLFTVLVMVGLTFSVILPYGIIALFGMITVFAGTVILYKTYTGHRR